MLQDAEVKAPRRVWRAVSRHLDSAAAAAAWWRWAVPAFAAAAAVAAVVFTWSGPNTSPATDSIVAQVVDSEESPVTTEASVTEVPSSVEASADSDVSASATPSVSVRKSGGSSRSGRSSGTVSASGIGSGSESLLADASERDASSGNASGAVSGSESVSGSDVVSGSESESGSTYSAEDAAKWAQISKENASKRSVRLSSLYAQGGVGGNDSNISYGGTGISHMAPGPGSADAGISEAGSSTYGVPFTLGLGTRFHMGEKFSLGTGLEYSLLTRTFNGTYSDNYTGGIYHAVQYIGVPVNAYYDLLSTRDGLFNLYAWGGGAAEVCVSNNYRLMSAPGTTIRDKAGSLQFSVALGVGVDIPISGKLSLYLDPAVRYYFHGNQPKSLRTDKPFMFNFDAGLRFNL